MQFFQRLYFTKTRLRKADCQLSLLNSQPNKKLLINETNTYNPPFFLFLQIFGFQEHVLLYHDNVDLFCTKRNSHDHWFEFIDTFVISVNWIFFVLVKLFPLEKNRKNFEFKLCKQYSGYCKLVVRTLE